MVMVGILWAVSLLVASNAPFLHVQIGDILGLILTWGYSHKFIVPTVARGIKAGSVKQ